MPRLYITPNQFASYPVAITFAFQVAQLAAVSGAMDMLLARASRRVDNYARKRIVAPGSTTVGTGGISLGSTSLPVASTLSFDNGQEQAVIINAGGGTQETIPLTPGGVQVSSWSSPYPGTLTLATSTAYSHSAGETAIGCYQEVSTVGSSGSSDVYSESVLALNQAAQLAQAHAPHFDTSGLTRIIFLKCYPIVSVLKMEHMLPIDSQYSTLDASQVGVQTAAGYLRLPIGSFVLPEGLFRTTYKAGFVYPNDDIQQATALYAADELQSMKYDGAFERQIGKTKGKYATDKDNKSRYVLDAEKLIDEGNYRRRT